MRQLRRDLRRNARGMVYRCMVWWRTGFKVPVPINETFEGEPSEAYGTFKERNTIEAAMSDMVALKLTSMKHSGPGMAFWPVVVEYPEGHPPERSRRTVYMVLGDDD